MKNHENVLAYMKVLRDKNLKGIVEMIPAYDSITVLYDPVVIRYEELEEELKKISGSVGKLKKVPKRLLKIPVCYDSSFGVDMKEVLSHCGISKSELIEIHTQPKYLVHMLGFTPGFMYLGGMDDRIQCPRKKKPRLHIKAGAVGIANDQTGVYPVESPGGWQIIGRTPVKLFDSEKDGGYFMAKQGDYVQFYPVSLEEYYQMEKEGVQPLIEKLK